MNKDKKCLKCGIKLSKINYYPAFDIEQNKNLEFCCRDCFEKYATIMKQIERKNF